MLDMIDSDIAEVLDERRAADLLRKEQNLHRASVDGCRCLAIQLVVAVVLLIVTILGATTGAANVLACAADYTLKCDGGSGACSEALVGGVMTSCPLRPSTEHGLLRTDHELPNALRLLKGRTVVIVGDSVSGQISQAMARTLLTYGLKPVANKVRRGPMRCEAFVDVAAGGGSSGGKGTSGQGDGGGGEGGSGAAQGARKKKGKGRAGEKGNAQPSARASSGVASPAAAAATTTVCYVPAGRSAGEVHAKRESGDEGRADGGSRGGASAADCKRRATHTESTHKDGIDGDRAGGQWTGLGVGDALDCLEQMSLIDPTRDVIIVNEGLHHNDPETTLPSNIDEFTAWYTRDATSRACVLWRQTTPQHFATTRGEWEGQGGIDANMRDSEGISHTGEYGCVPLQAPDLLRAFMGGEYAAGGGPLGFKASYQRYNDVADPMLEAAGVVNIKAWPVLAPLFNLHPLPGKQGYIDCTHSIVAVNVVVAHLLLAAIDETCAVAL